MEKPRQERVTKQAAAPSPQLGLGPLDLQSLQYLELEGALGALRDVLVETLLGIVRQLEGDLGGAAGPRHQQQQQ